MRAPLKSTAAVGLLLAAASLCSAAEVDNPLYKNWTQFKPGTSITMANVADFNGKKIENEQITTLLSLDAGKAVIEMTFVQNGKSTPAGKLEIAAKTPAADPPPTPPVPPSPPANNVKPTTETKESEDVVEVLGKKIKCKLSVTTDSSDGSVTKFWTSNEIPGQMVKSEFHSGGDAKISSSSSIKSMTIK